jgi:hypothetical protein
MIHKTAKKTKVERRSLFQRLLKSTSGNTLAMGAAAIVPLIGMIGGGLDMSRAYLVRTKMQQACDAAALAARKKLAGGTITAGVIPGEIHDHADDFFDINFAEGDYGSENVNFALTSGGDTRMDGAASVDLPMALMQVLGFGDMEIAVECSAELNLPNVDVMLVLDQSGSMNSGTRMPDLRDAVFAFYDEMMAAAPPGARIRIGAVPYSGTVNVGRILYNSNPNWIADSWQYQTRVAEFVPGGAVGARKVPVGAIEASSLSELAPKQRYLVPYEYSDWEIVGLYEDENEDNLPGNSPFRWPSTGAASDRCQIAVNGEGGDWIVGDELWRIDSDDFDDDQIDNGPSGMRGACDLRIHRFRIEDPEDYEDLETLAGVPNPPVFDRYRHLEATIDTSAYKTFANVVTQTGTQGANVTSSWNGCIEERQTAPVTNFDPIPATALDLDINLVPDPTKPETQWKPQWRQITYARRDRDNQSPAEWTTTSDRSTHSFNCPSEALKLQEFPLSGGSRNSTFENYINGLTPQGGTMHDIGMIWAGRFITGNGLFTAENATAPNGDPISRHIIFMSDGEMGADPRNYIAYGNANMDGRFMGFKGSGRWSEAETAAVNNKRLAAICERIKNENITIWTVTFEYPQNTFTRACASGTNRAYEANGGTELAAAFRRIAGSIAELRLVN